MRYDQGGHGAGWRAPAAARFDAWSAAQDDPSPIVEELTTTPIRSVGRPMDRRLGLVVGLIAAVVGFGFMTHDAHSGTVHGGADIPSAHVASSPTAASDVATPQTVSLVRSGPLMFGSTLSIGVFQDVGGASWLTVDAFGMSTDGFLDIEARTISGILVACASLAALGDDERPISGGTARLGLGSVHARVLIRGHASSGTLAVTIEWRDVGGFPPGSTTGPARCPTAGR